jgi:hypothetical protein
MVPKEEGPLLFLVAVIGIWGTLLVLIAEQAVRGTLAWWYRRGQHGNHHPTGPAARTVEEIHHRLRREADRPIRSIVIRPRMVTPPGQHSGLCSHRCYDDLKALSSTAR